MIYIIPAIKWDQHTGHFAEPNQYGVMDARGNSDNVLNSPVVKSAEGMVMGATTIDRILEKSSTVNESTLDDLIERYFYKLGFVENVLMMVRAIYKAGSNLNIFVVFGNKAYAAIAKEVAKRINKMTELHICSTFDDLVDDSNNYNGKKKKLPGDIKQKLERTGSEFSEKQLKRAVEKLDKLRDKIKKDVERSDEEFGYKKSKERKKNKIVNDDGSLLVSKKYNTKKEKSKDVWREGIKREKKNLLEALEPDSKKNKYKNKKAKNKQPNAWRSIIDEWDSGVTD